MAGPPNTSKGIAWSLLALIVIVIVSRLPFLDAGYGANADAWRVAWAGREWAETGRYVASRFPGYPLHEGLAALVWRGGPVALNSISLVASVLAAVALFFLAREARLDRPWLIALTFAFVPIIFVNSVTAKDYLPALSAVLGSLVLARRGHAIWAGVCLGVAVGLRPTSAAMGLPIVIPLLAGREGARAQLATLLRFAGPAVLVALAAYALALSRYGVGFVRAYYHEEEVADILAMLTIHVWGTIGCVGLMVALLLLLGLPALRRKAGADRIDRLTWIAAILVSTAVYFSLPHQPGYWIPGIPFTLLLVASVAGEIPRLLFFAGTALSSFVDYSHGRMVPGAIFQDRALRFEQMRDTDTILALAKSLPEKSVLVVYGQFEHIRALHPELTDPRHPRFAYLLDRAEAVALRQRGYRIVCSDQINAINAIVHGFNLADVGADIVPSGR